MAKHSLQEQEMIDILEEIARNATNGAARIAAIKQLREMDDGCDHDDWAELDELAPRRRTAA